MAIKRATNVLNDALLKPWLTAEAAVICLNLLPALFD